MIRFFTKLKPFGWVATAVALLIIFYIGRSVVVGLQKWHYNAFILPKVTELLQPYENALNRIKLDSIKLATYNQKLLQDSTIKAGQIQDLQKLNLEMRAFKKDADKCKNEIAFLKNNPVRVDLVTIRLNVFGKIKDSTYTESYKWIK